MPTNYETVIDSYAWIEYFRGSPSGERARQFIEKGSSATASITLAEMQEKYLREKWDTFEADLDFIATNTAIIPTDREIAISGGRINYENKKKIRNWGMADSIILATARVLSAKVVTGDPHFKGMKESIMI